ncbi:phage tail tube protein [Roseovarius aestuarii]|nr:phage tail tube protein [Roseovarius aestuarii]
MAKQNPDLMLIKIGDGEESESFSTLCGLNSRNLTLDGDNIDVTTIDCSGGGGKLFQEMVAGTAKVSFSGSGYFESKAQSTVLIDSKLSGTGINNYEIIVPGLGEFAGAFIIDSIGVSGEVNGGAITQEFALSSTGAITFTAET